LLSSWNTSNDSPCKGCNVSFIGTLKDAYIVVASMLKATTPIKERSRIGLHPFSSWVSNVAHKLGFSSVYYSLDDHI